MLVKKGCVVGSLVVNHLMYADYLVIISPSTAGLQSLLKICSDYGYDNDVKYNAKKSHVMIIRCKEHRRLVFPDFYLCGAKLNVCTEVMYLGHFFLLRTFVMIKILVDSVVNYMLKVICSLGNFICVLRT